MAESGNLSYEKELLQTAFEVMSDSYESLFIVDLENNDMKAIRRNPKLPKPFWDYVDTNPTYVELLDYYIKAGVAPIDRKRMNRLASIEMIKSAFDKSQSYSFDYRVPSATVTVWYRMRFANLSQGEKLTKFAVGFENVSEEKKAEEFSLKENGKILVVNEDSEDIILLKNGLSNEYDLISSTSIEDAIRIIEESYQDIMLILLGYESDMSLVFIEEVRSEKKYGSIPIIVLSDDESVETELTVLDSGASDFIHKPFNTNVISHRIAGLLKLRQSTAMLNTLERDPLTGLYNKEFFYRRVEEVLTDDPDGVYYITISNIEKFKLINEKYGQEMGNKVLRSVADAIRIYYPEPEVLGRLNSDVFASLQKGSLKSIDEANRIMQSIIEEMPVPNIVFKYGVYHIDRNVTMTAQSMCDRAKLAVQSIKGVYGKNLAVYDDKFRQELLVNQQIIENMETALKNKQFEVYLQPKVGVKEGQVVGAEALVRWIHPELGFISPGKFIPVFEQNGFIAKLDLYVFARVVDILIKWKEEGKEPIPISINLSRRDFDEDDMVDNIKKYLRERDIDHSLIHFELTETAYSDNPERIAGIINELHKEGFIIELDDFGTGYSSLTTLNDIDIDILKLDMSIIQNDIPGSEKNVLDFCMQLVKMMKLKAVAEGAETKEQIERLENLGCDYIQGFYYSKPLPLNEFEDYINNSKL